VTKRVRAPSPSVSLLAGVLLAASLGRADKPGAVEEGLRGAADSAASTTKAEIIKKGLAGLVQVARLSDPETAEEAANEVAQAVNGLEMDAKQTQEFFNRLQKMDRAELSRLVKRKGNGVLAYGQSLLKGEGSDIARIKAALARGGDEAGLDAVRLVRRLEEGLPVSKDDLMKALKSLPPEKSTTLLDAFRSEFKRGGPVKQQLMDSVGTMVDGVFVFNDAVNIYYSDDPPEEKAAAATGKGVEFGLGAVGGVAASAVGGGFGANLVLGWSAGQVGELTKEMIGLYHDRQNAALKEQWAELELREMTLRKMLEVDRLIKAGKLDQALEQSKKLRQFYDEHEDTINDDAVGKHLVDLRKNLGEASHKQTALARLSEARRPYERALASYRKRANLKQAQEEARQARQILERWASTYPELGEPLSQVRKLETDIAQAMATATPVQLVRIQGPARVVVGDWAEFHLDASGGIPWYCSTSDGVCGSTFATAFWKASGQPGSRTIAFRLKDDIGQVAAKETTVEVLPGTGEPAAAAAGSGKPRTGGSAGSERPSASGLDPACQRAQQCCWANVQRMGAKSDGGACSSLRTRAQCDAYIKRGVCG
jgi:hypothetical protein